MKKKMEKKVWKKKFKKLWRLQMSKKMSPNEKLTSLYSGTPRKVKLIFHKNGKFKQKKMVKKYLF